MGTGLTNMLDDDSNLTTAKWMTEGLARSFGVCIILRDDEWGISEEDIEARLKESSSVKYHEENLAEAEWKLTEIASYSEETWIEKHLAHVKETEKRNKERTERANKTKLRHDKVRKELTKVQFETHHDVTRNLAEYGLKQLDVAKSDTKPYLKEIPTLEQFKAEKLKSLNWSSDYHSKNREESRLRESGRLLAYQTIRSEVKRILG